MTTSRPRLLLLFAPADHPHRDAVCATLAWLAEAEGRLFDCYYDSPHSGVHFGGGLPWLADPADLRGGTFSGGHHREQFEALLEKFDCVAACLGDTVFTPILETSKVELRARSGDVVEFYRELFAGSDVGWPDTLLVIAPGRDPVSAVPYACHEVVQRRVLAIAGGDPDAEATLGADMRIERLWADDSSIEARSLAMAERWSKTTRGYLLADPEVVGRWIPAAARNGWAPLYGIPQVGVVNRISDRLEGVDVVWGRQQDDADFMALSRAGAAFQLVDPGRPPFPVIAEAAAQATLPAPLREPEPSDEVLAGWAADGRVVTSIVFWAGMVRELECFYGLMDVLRETGLKSGVALTTESFRYLDSNPLGLLGVEKGSGGLAGQVEALLASAGAGGMLESAAPAERFAGTLRAAVCGLSELLGGRDRVPVGWWGVMDAPLVPRKLSRVRVSANPPAVKLRYRRRALSYARTDVGGGGGGSDLRRRIRESPLSPLFEPIRPFDEWQPGPPSRAVLSAVGQAGFEYALTKSEFGAPPTLVTGVDGLSVVNYTSGRWDGWTPFETINDLGDVSRAERRLLRSGQPGWLLGSIDTCLWTFSAYMEERGAELRRICRRLAEGGESGRLIDVTPRTLARYARVLGERGLVRKVEAT